MKEINEVKKDLKELKKSMYASRAIESAVETHLARIKTLKNLPQTERIIAIILKEETLLNRLNALGRVEEAQLLENRYMEAILSLDPTDKTIALNTYINGVPYWKTGTELGFSEEGVRKRITKIIKKIALAL
jgi:DNA-directed RNA polymerase specialized sigma subunit